MSMASNPVTTMIKPCPDCSNTALETKLNTAENELVQAQANLDVATKFSKRLGIEEQITELKARDNVVRGYLKKGKKRLNCLRERYMELLVQGRGGGGTEVMPAQVRAVHIPAVAAGQG
jgi:hypothetical protein